MPISVHARNEFIKPTISYVHIFCSYLDINIRLQIRLRTNHQRKLESSNKIKNRTNYSTKTSYRRTTMTDVNKSYLVV